jgi:hypothetical protein
MTSTARRGRWRARGGIVAQLDNTSCNPYATPPCSQTDGNGGSKPEESLGKALQTETFQRDTGLRRKPPIMDRTQEVAGSSPASSIKNPLETAGSSWSQFADRAGCSPVTRRAISKSVEARPKEPSRPALAEHVASELAPVV